MTPLLRDLARAMVGIPALRAWAQALCMAHCPDCGVRLASVYCDALRN